MPGRLPTLVPRDDREACVIQVWQTSGRRNGTICVYLRWVRRFRNHWREQGIDEVDRLTLSDVLAYSRSYYGSRRGRDVKACTRASARNALHAWSCALRIAGVRVPDWCPAPRPQRWPPLLMAYAQYRRSHRGVAAATLARDMDVASQFVRALRARGRKLGTARVEDLDSFVEALSARLSRRTVASLCSSLRCLLRFLQVTGRVRSNLASCVIAPRYRVDEQPPRALPWDVVRRILRTVPRDQPIGRRDFAMLLLMTSYGLAPGEVVRLRLGDIDWRGGVLRTQRRKTGSSLELPLLPAVAKALAAYLQHVRPTHIKTREIFVRSALPHGPITTSVLRAQVRLYARAVGIESAVIGAHVLRHSHATRQIDVGAHPKVVSDILGHRRPSSTSVYVRVALRRLRSVALPVPR